MPRQAPMPNPPNALRQQRLPQVPLFPGDRPPPPAARLPAPFGGPPLPVMVGERPTPPLEPLSPRDGMPRQAPMPNPPNALRQQRLPQVPLFPGDRPPPPAARMPAPFGGPPLPATDGERRDPPPEARSPR